jgi:hypothetical protein
LTSPGCVDPVEVASSAGDLGAVDLRGLVVGEFVDGRAPDVEVRGTMSPVVDEVGVVDVSLTV